TDSTVECFGTGPGAPGGLGPVRTITARADDTCAIAVDGTLTCWGVGDHATGAPTGPVTSVGVGYAHACATTVDGPVFCWGDNVGGQLGQATAFHSGPI